LEGENTTAAKILINAPSPIYPKDSLTLSFLDFDAVELARQLTLMDYEVFCKIKAREFIGANWIKEKVNSPNLLKYINWGRNIMNWLVTEVVSQSNPKLQIQTVEKIIRMGQVYDILLTLKHMEILNNFSGVKIIVAVLKSPAVNHLKKIKEVTCIIND
jgi:hypothetical protein